MAQRLMMQLSAGKAHQAVGRGNQSAPEKCTLRIRGEEEQRFWLLGMVGRRKLQGQKTQKETQEWPQSSTWPGLRSPSLRQSWKHSRGAQAMEKPHVGHSAWLGVPLQSGLFPKAHL